MTGTTWRSAIVAAAFAIHPLRVESVAWISERKDVLSGLLFMLTLGAYAGYVGRRCLSRYVLVTLLFSAGLLAKPMLVTTPFVLLLLDYWPLRRLGEGERTGESLPRLVGEKIPLLFLSAGSCVATLVAQKQYIGSGEELPISARLANVVLSYVWYLKKMLWPSGLVPFYPHDELSVGAVQVSLAALLLVTITAISVSLRKKSPHLLVGWLWYLGMLIPVIGLVQVGWQARADRYTYLPQIGVAIAITWAIADLTRRSRMRQLVAISLGGCIIVALAATAFVQTSHWRNSEALWTRTLAVIPNNDVAENNLGILLLARGRADEAADHFQRALTLRPGNVAAHTNIANVLVARGELNAGLAHLRQALELEPADADAGNLLGFVLLRQGDVRGALAQWHDTLAKNPGNGNARSNLAWIYATHPEAALRDGDRAVQLAKEAVDLSGGRNALVLRTLAAAYAETGDFDHAVTTARAARDLAAAQGNSALVAELDATIELYHSRTPLRDTSLAQPRERL